MRFIKNLSIASKIVILATFLAAIFLGTSFGFIVYQSQQKIIEATVDSFETSLRGKKEVIEARIDGVVETVSFLSKSPPIQGVIRAREGGGFDQVDQSSLEQWKTRLQQIFYSEIETVDLYEQLRYIDENGQELVRVNAGEMGPVVVIEGDLQNKSDRQYFKDTMKLDQDVLYVSATELNREGTPAVIVEPHTPVVRYAFPIFDENTGARRGVVIANVFVDRLLEASQAFRLNDSDFYVTNNQGYFIYHPDDTQRFGSASNLDTGITIFDEFSDICCDNLSHEPRVHSYQGQSNIYAHVTLYLNPQGQSRQWHFFEVTTKNRLFAGINTIAITSLLAGVGTFVALFFVFLFFIKLLLRPLEKITKGVKGVTQGKFDMILSVNSNDEIGKVATAFNTMSKKLQNSYGLLQKSVRARTKELDVKVDELEKTKKAMLNLLEDIDSEKEALAKEKAQDEAILSSIGDGLIVTNAKREILIINQAAQKMLKVKEKELIGKKWPEGLSADVISDEGYRRLDSGEWMITQALKEKKVVSNNKLNYMNKEKQRFPVAVTAAPVFNKKEVIGVVVVFRDITREREIDKAKTEFVSLASHQLRTPLSTINWYAEMLIDGDAGKITKQQKEYLEEIYEGNQRMVDLVNALLNVSRIELGTFMIEPEKVKLEDIAKSVTKELKPQLAEKKHKLVEKYDSKVPEISVDPKLTRIIFQNLLTNAVKYTPAKGSITLSIKKDKSNVLITVKDNGMGIPKAQQKHIFTKLFRADNVKESDTTGTGLGLYLIKSIVENVGGDVWFKSQLNKGTTFFVTLPLEGMKAKEGTRRLGD